MGDDRRHEARHGSVSSDEGDGTPHCWNPEWLLRQPGEFEDGVVVLPRYEASSDRWRSP